MPTDVLIITALYDELLAVLNLGDQGRLGWTGKRDPSGFQFHQRSFALANAAELSVASAWSGAMGEMAAADRSRSLIEHLRPLTLAMCGICAGRRGDVFLGDVILADRVFSYDHGKLIASVQDGHRVEQIFRDIETYNLEKVWAMDAAYFADDLGWSQSLAAERPVSMESQRGWLLRALFAHELEGKAPPKLLPDRQARCPNWPNVLKTLLGRKQAVVFGGKIQLTPKGRAVVEDERAYYPDGPPLDPPFKVVIGPIATGKTVRQDPELFAHLEHFSRKAVGVEMEAAAIGYVAERSGIPSLIAKAVSDYGDNEKDNNFRAFACRASAEFLLAFLKQHSPRSRLKQQALSVPNVAPQDLSKQIVSEILSGLLASGVEIKLPKGSPRGSLFYCESGGGHRAIGAALNNSGLIAYVGPKELMRVIDLDQRTSYEIEPLTSGNQFIHFARLKGATQGLRPSYLNQVEVSGLDREHHAWIAFDRDGEPVRLTQYLVYTTISVTADSEEILLDDMVIATKKAEGGLVIGGPVLSATNEIVGFAIASFETRQKTGQVATHVVVWPWVSLNSVLMEGQVLDSPPSLTQAIPPAPDAAGSRLTDSRQPADT